MDTKPGSFPDWKSSLLNSHKFPPVLISAQRDPSWILQPAMHRCLAAEVMLS